MNVLVPEKDVSIVAVKNVGTQNMPSFRPSNPAGQCYPALSKASNLPTCFLGSYEKQNRARSSMKLLVLAHWVPGAGAKK